MKSTEATPSCVVHDEAWISRPPLSTAKSRRAFAGATCKSEPPKLTCSKTKIAHFIVMKTKTRTIQAPAKRGKLKRIAVKRAVKRVIAKRKAA